MAVTNFIKIFFVTLFFVIFSYYCAVILHEYGHSLMSWVLGEKSTPFDIIYGIQGNKGWLLESVDENVNYDAIFSTGQNLKGTLIGASGIITNFILAIIFVVFLKNNYIQKNLVLFSFCFWEMVVNWMLFFGYVFYLGINSQGDIGIINKGLGISPWWVYCTGLIIGFIGIYHILRHEIIKAYAFHLSNSLTVYRTYLIVTLITLFYLIFIRSILLYTFFGEPFVSHGYKMSITHLYSIALIIAIVLFFIFDPKRRWIGNAIREKGQTTSPAMLK